MPKGLTAYRSYKSDVIMLTEEERLALEAKEKEFKATLEGLSDEEKTQKIAEREALLQNNTEIENALKIEREKRLEAEKRLEETRIKAKERFEENRKKEEEEEDKPLTKKEFQALLEIEREKDRKNTQEERAGQIAQSLSENPKEAELVLEVWRNRTLPGSLTEQLKEAHVIATAKRTQAQNEELIRALANKDGENEDGLNSQRKASLAGEPNLDTNDKSVLKGFTWDGGRYKKVIAGGKKIFYVSRDLKKRWIENAK